MSTAWFKFACPASSSSSPSPSLSLSLFLSLHPPPPHILPPPPPPPPPQISTPVALPHIPSMASLAAAALDAATRQVPVGQTLSGIFGSISLTAWICLLVWLPQVAHSTASPSSLTCLAAPAALGQLQGQERRRPQCDFSDCVVLGRCVKPVGYVDFCLWLAGQLDYHDARSFRGC